MVGKHPLIIGMGLTGRSIHRWYADQGIKAYTYDDTNPTHIPWGIIDAVHPSPGIAAHHTVYQKALTYGLPVGCDAHIAQHMFPRHRFVGITGSNGKSTTCALVAHLLDAPVLLSGNISIPILDRLPHDERSHTFVWELSSFQLDIGSTLRFDAAACLNLSPNHLDRHGTMEAYTKAKMRIFDQAQWSLVGKNVPLPHAGRFESIESVCRIQDDHVCVMGNTLSIPKQLIGAHNRMNAACAIAIAIRMGTNLRAIRDRLSAFQPLEHRLETVWRGEWHNKHLCIVNDSKSTTAHATLCALQAFEGRNIWWIGGGVPKAGGIQSITKPLRKVQHAYLMGQAAAAFEEVLRASGMKRTTQSHTLAAAVQQSLRDIQDAPVQSATLLLSPACASYDQFKSFEHRGRVFKECVLSCVQKATGEPHSF